MQVIKESAIHLRREDGSLVEIPAGEPFELPDDEANARIEAGDVQPATPPPSLRGKTITALPDPTPEPTPAPAPEDTK